jgi:hypothetical protein
VSEGNSPMDQQDLRRYRVELSQRDSMLLRLERLLQINGSLGAGYVLFKKRRIHYVLHPALSTFV